MKILAIAVLVALTHTAVSAQTPSKPLTSAELRAKVTSLEQTIADLQRDYQLLLTTCQAPSPPPRGTAATPMTERSILEAVRTEQARRAPQEPPDDQQERLEAQSWYIKDSAFGVTESNRVFVRYGWRVTVKNGIPRAQRFDLVVQFLDANGLIVDTARLFRQVIAAQDEQTFRGDALISMPGALSVVSAHAIATRHAEER